MRIRDDFTVFPLYLSVSPALRLVRELSGLKVRYLAGYVPGNVPADLASACLELAAWNMSRYRGPPPRSRFFIGLTGAVRGLLEPYMRRTI